MNAPDPRLPSAPTPPSHAERLFPTLSEAQINRIAAQGLRRQTTKGEMLIAGGYGAVTVVGSTHSAGTLRASESSSHATAIRIATSTSIAIGTSRSCSINSTLASTISPS